MEEPGEERSKAVTSAAEQCEKADDSPRATHNKRTLNVPRPPEGEAAPGAERQRQIITALEGEEESLHVYCVAKQWYEAWKSWVGLSGGDKAGARPGELHMDTDNEDNNTYIDEKIWKKWIKWFGISDQHELDRRNWASDDKQFEICILNPYSGIVQNPLKTFDISEQTGYIELQLRRIFRVPRARDTRLWSCEKARSARFHLLLDRAREICLQDQVEQKREHILALEIAGLDGTWPTHVPGAPCPGFSRYAPVTDAPRPAEYWEHELADAVTTVFAGIGAELQETVAGIVNTSKCITHHQQRDLAKARDKLDSRLQLIADTQSKLDCKLREAVHTEEAAQQQAKRAHEQRQQLDSERNKFESELKRMEELNRIQEARVRLDIGGHTYMTSTLTLGKDPGSMLAAMFSGRHALSKEQDGSYFIDRDGTHFRYILNFLRDGGFREGTLPRDKGVLTELLTEAEYYQIGELSTLLRDLVGAGEDDHASPMRLLAASAPRHKPARKISIRK